MEENVIFAFFRIPIVSKLKSNLQWKMNRLAFESDKSKSLNTNWEKLSELITAPGFIWKVCTSCLIKIEMETKMFLDSMRWIIENFNVLLSTL